MPRLIKNLKEMQEFAAEVTRKLMGGEVLLLSGPLGAGKTTFTQALARALGVTATVHSPSYTIVGEYHVSGHPLVKKLIHVDLYRLEDPTSPRFRGAGSAADDPAVRDVLEQIREPGRLTVIEWAERLGGVAPQGKWIKFDYGSTADERVVTVEDNGA